MPKPIVLIKKDTLEALYAKRVEGVPVAKILRKAGLAISSPTLTNLFKYLDLRAKTKDQLIVDTINNSLFPAWVEDGQHEAAAQDFNVNKYVGLMPLGEWITC